MRKMTDALFTVVLLAAATSVRAESSMLKTQTGYDIGLSLSYYQYHEPGLMSLKGGKIGLNQRITKAFQNDLFIRGDLRHAFGAVDYNSNGTGSAKGKLDLYLEIRGLVGKDWLTNAGVFSPYTGLGYRYLFNDLRGNTSTGHWGYRRESNYLYLPIGFIHRTLLDSHAQLESTVEYDHLLAGQQISYLSDVTGYSDVTNNQSKGYGLKLSIMYEKSKWAIGPYAHYWNIDRSEIVPEIRFGVLTGRGLVEPENNTLEFGFKVRHQL